MVKNWRDLYMVTKSTKMVREVFRVNLSILEGMSKIFTSGTHSNQRYNIVSSIPSGENVFPKYFVIFTHNLKFIVEMSLKKKNISILTT